MIHVLWGRDGLVCLSDASAVKAESGSAAFSLNAARHPPRTPGRQVGSPRELRPQFLEEAGAVGAQVLRDKLAWKLGLLGRRAFRLLFWVQKSLPTRCGNCG